MDGAAPTHDDLLELTRRQARLIGELRAEVDRFRRELEEARRAGKRQASASRAGACRPIASRTIPRPGCPITGPMSHDRSRMACLHRPLADAGIPPGHGQQTSTAAVRL